ncbi:hypothetical protein CDL12_12795 [Handroanthus impetiginosus]|uniref:Uncharacterized protein n=1 Tax=Handroanthus impetiginosus TaxID=429701 RepID=A0A2G9HAJ8_9LAMI|nr:hypothetical protein CDL12_12795 [Handroanthus impetiginosus]
MADENPTTAISSFLCYPKFLNGLWTKSASDTETTLMSPTSILDTKNPSIFQNPFKSSPKYPNANSKIPKSEPQATGLALIESLNSEKSDENYSNYVNRKVLFQSNLSSFNLSLPFPAESPSDFGIKTRSSQVSSLVSETPTKNLAKQLSLKEMEVCEDYTCVIIHGPNPKTTHIFDDCVVESSCGEDVEVCDQKKKESDHECEDIYTYRG